MSVLYFCAYNQWVVIFFGGGGVTSRAVRFCCVNSVPCFLSFFLPLSLSPRGTCISHLRLIKSSSVIGEWERRASI